MRTARRAGASLVVGILLAACDAPNPAPVPVPVPPAPAPSLTATAACADGFRITATDVEAAMGLRAMGLVLENCGARPYELNGFPVIRLLDDRHATLGVTVGNGSQPVSAPDAWDAPAKPVTVPPGETARARVLWRNTVTDGEAVTATHLAVTPAPDAPEQLVTPDGGIDLGTTARLAVNAWVLSKE
ncbi:DUF4232 domain-containing protein [Asanoa sp. WMMD1127]|uniref:DUF4232 domain-containing protein n=1 Tax=Asanoa sp. WMMD1127 TaxID=3016107 RepID=UPI002417E1E0|nr:DUF4232 domain-containing protein [Asanoa sp. WMMD1127]MDG4825926.1 DUF4232 domain-containing protein [Asanoa sp. WMMD1127]